MPMIRKLTFIVLLLLIIVPVCLYANDYLMEEDEEDEINPVINKEAVDFAEKWLKIIDSGNYKESWEYTADFFRKRMSKEQWIESLKTSRKPLGKLLSRSFESNFYFTSGLPAAPDGDYIVLQFSTSFKKKKETNEALLLFLDSKGEWRVCGYSIRKE